MHAAPALLAIPRAWLGLFMEMPADPGMLEKPRSSKHCTELCTRPSLLAYMMLSGLFGTGSTVLPFSKMNTADDMAGLSLGLSCTQRSPMWMESKASSGSMPE
ncbi:hypothetical protein ACP70R_005918 [Stipagrostis hirtigluma subsp. patula]